VKLTDCTYACNSLTDFEYEELEITGNGNNVNQLTLARKIRETTCLLQSVSQAMSTLTLDPSAPSPDGSLNGLKTVNGRNNSVSPI